MADAARLRHRLESMRPVPGVLPTQRLGGLRNARLRTMAADLEAGNLALAEAESASHLGGLLARDHHAGSAVAELASSRKAIEQLACFARGGYNFFKATGAFLGRSLSDRRAEGGNGAIRRLWRSGDHLLLETARFIVRFVPEASQRERLEALNRHDLVSLRPLRFANAQHCATERDNVIELCLRLMEDPLVEYAEPDFIEAVPQRRQPADPEFANQWHHQVIGNPRAWDIATGAAVRIAVIDNGCDRHHPDISADNELSGWFRPSPDNEDALFIPGLLDLPDADHGTACAGMAAACGNGDPGGTGVAYDAKLAVIACLPNQVGTQLTLARALAYAADPAMEVTSNFTPGADVISCSLGPNSASWEMRGILSDAIDFVAASGRHGLGAPLFWACTNGHFPISADEVCAHRETIVVGCSTADDGDGGSGFGPELDFLAPGVNVWVPASGGGYHAATGTSLAAPCAAGVAALALARNDCMTAREVRELMRQHTDRVGPVPYDESGRNDQFGFGRISAWEVLNALREVQTAASSSTAPRAP